MKFLFFFKIKEENIQNKNKFLFNLPHYIIIKISTILIILFICYFLFFVNGLNIINNFTNRENIPFFFSFVFLSIYILNFSNFIYTKFVYFFFKFILAISFYLFVSNLWINNNLAFYNDLLIKFLLFVFVILINFSLYSCIKLNEKENKLDNNSSSVTNITKVAKFGYKIKLNKPRRLFYFLYFYTLRFITVGPQNDNVTCFGFLNICLSIILWSYKMLLNKNYEEYLLLILLLISILLTYASLKRNYELLNKVHLLFILYNMGVVLVLLFTNGVYEIVIKLIFPFYINGVTDQIFELSKILEYEIKYLNKKDKLE